MSSLKNAVKRSTHKERAQPSSRHRFGLLEKKKDYLQRARNHQKQEQTLQILREKAENRNPDEYYAAMQREQLHGANPGAGRMTDAEIKTLKAQDLLHAMLRSQKHRKHLERMQESLHFIGAPATNSHTVFVENPQALRSFSAEEHFDTPEELLSRTFNRPRTAQLEGAAAAAAEPGAASVAAAPYRAVARHAKQRAGAYQRLLDTKQTGQQLEGLVNELLIAHVAASKGRKRPIHDTSGKLIGHRFKRARQR